METGNLIEKLHENSMLCLSRFILYQHILNFNQFILYPQQYTDTTYSKVIFLLYGASHCTKDKSSGTLTLDTIDLLGEATRKLNGNGANSIGTGIDFSRISTLDPAFKDLKILAYGSVPSLMFWTPEQKKILCEHHSRSVIYGQYGSGKTVILTEKIKRMIQSVIDDFNKIGE